MQNRDYRPLATRVGKSMTSTKPVGRLRKAVRMGLLSLPVGAALALPSAQAMAQTEDGRRVALVIGNQEYQYVTPLENPVTDTTEIARILREADFDVTIGTDLNKKDLEQVVRRFLRELNDGDTALFYYSGHALQVGESNFILPVDAKLSSQYDLEFESLKVSHLLDYMKAASSLQIVMLDACRDNPFEIASLFWGEEEYSLGKTRGLRRIPNKLGTFISYATRPGQVAYDGKGPMSPFTSSVVENALDPALEIKDLMTKVRDDVVRKTGGQQIPYEDSTLVTSFYFVPPKPAPIVTAHHRVSVSASAESVPISIPEPVQPEGGTLKAKLTLLPEKGTLKLPGGRAVAEGDVIDAAELASLEFFPEGSQPGDVELISYEVEDQWGGSASAIASITVAQAEAPVQNEQVEENRTKRLEALLSWLGNTASKGAVEADIGTGPVNVYPDAPVEDLPATSDWLKVVSVDTDLQLASDNRLLQAGDRFPVSALATLTVRPQIGSESEARKFALELPAVEGTPARTITQIVQTPCNAVRSPGNPAFRFAGGHGRTARQRSRCGGCGYGLRRSDGLPTRRSAGSFSSAVVEHLPPVTCNRLSVTLNRPTRWDMFVPARCWGACISWVPGSIVTARRLSTCTARLRSGETPMLCIRLVWPRSRVKARPRTKRTAWTNCCSRWRQAIRSRSMPLVAST